MDHSEHAALMIAAVVFVMAAGLIVLALAWRRAYRGGGSGVVLGGLTRGRTIVSVAFVPTAGLLGLVSLAIVAPLIR